VLIFLPRFATLPLVFIAILLLSTFPYWHEIEDDNGSGRVVKPFPSRPVSYIVLVLLTLSSLLIFVSVFWQHIASSAAMTMGQSLSYGTVKGKVGTVAMALGWTAVFLDILAGIAIYVTILSIKVLEEIFD
jgi:Ca2+ regulator and membrane fusion protein Fig1